MCGTIRKGASPEEVAEFCLAYAAFMTTAENGEDEAPYENSPDNLRRFANEFLLYQPKEFRRAAQKLLNDRSDDRLTTTVDYRRDVIA